MTNFWSETSYRISLHSLDDIVLMQKGIKCVKNTIINKNIVSYFLMQARKYLWSNNPSKQTWPSNIQTHNTYSSLKNGYFCSEGRKTHARHLSTTSHDSRWKIYYVSVTFRLLHLNPLRPEFFLKLILFKCNNFSLRIQKFNKRAGNKKKTPFRLGTNCN